MEIFTQYGLHIYKLGEHIYKATNTNFEITAHVENIDEYTRLTICKDYKGKKKLRKHYTDWLAWILEDKGFIPPLKETIL